MARTHFGFEVKFAAAETADGTFSGYGAVFGNVDSYGDVIAKGAFKDSIAKAKSSGIWPAMLISHGMYFGQDSVPVGIWTDLAEDDKGLRVEGKLAIETQRGAELYALLKMEPRPAISGLSVGYVATDYVMGQKAGEPRRTLNKVDLFEVSFVTTPANDKARIDGVKSGLTEREFENWLVRDAGFSAREAKTIISSGFKSLPTARDAGGSEDAEAIAALGRLERALRA